MPTPSPQTDHRWLDCAVIEGLQALLALRLRGAPAADTVDAVAEVWLAVFRARDVRWQPGRDASRIRAAFLATASRVEHWPAPAAVLAALPPVPEPPRLPPPKGTPMPPELRAKLRGLIAHMNATPARAHATRTPPMKGKRHD